jgi:site-specific DNA-methyltransferase (adenine-specific)
MYEQFNQYSSILKDELKVSYLHALFLMSRDILEGYVNPDVSEETSLVLDELLDVIQEFEFKKEDVRKTLVALTLNGYKQDNISNSEITPDTISLLVGYVANHLFKKETKLSVIDPVVGTGSLLTNVCNTLKKDFDLVGIDSNLDNIQLARGFADLQEYSVDYLLEDSIESGITGFDLVVGDIPLYIYNDEYFPHVLVNKSLDMMNDDGYALFVIPNDFFEIEGKYKAEIQEKATMLGLIKLPDDMFVDIKLAKSILIMKKKDDIHQDFLLVDLPSLSNQVEFRDSIKKIDNWFNKEEV